VAGRPEYREIEQKLDADLMSWMRETEDPGLEPGIPQPLHNPVQWPIPGKVIDVKRR